jgi:hypothetical protein
MDDTTRNNTPLVPENHVTVYSRYSNHHSSDYIFTSCEGFLKPFIEANPWNGEASLEALDSRANTVCSHADKYCCAARKDKQKAGGRDLELRGKG